MYVVLVCISAYIPLQSPTYMSVYVCRPRVYVILYEYIFVHSTNCGYVPSLFPELYVVNNFSLIARGLRHGTAFGKLTQVTFGSEFGGYGLKLEF